MAASAAGDSLPDIALEVATVCGRIRPWAEGLVLETSPSAGASPAGTSGDGPTTRLAVVEDNEDNRVLVPITTAAERLSNSRTSTGLFNVQTINVKARGPDSVDDVVNEVTTILRLRHQITTEDDFTVSNQQDTLYTLNETNETFAMFLGAIAGISLLVGGIGIMNIMLVSVTERTREIGMRKALGARRRDILYQFVTEALLLSITGGGIGVALGALLTRLADGRTIAGQDVETVFSSDIAVLALGVSAVIGLFFGIYPAARAARLHPIEALRHD